MRQHRPICAGDIALPKGVLPEDFDRVVALGLGKTLHRGVVSSIEGLVQ
jgi:hypothetical protein